MMKKTAGRKSRWTVPLNQSPAAAVTDKQNVPPADEIIFLNLLTEKSEEISN